MEATQSAYQQYTKGDYFREVSRRVKARDGHKCVACGETRGLQAHHNTYAHRGRELDHLGDLTTLCQRCHCAFHRKVGIWVGSDNALEALVNQADKLCSMSLTASNRLLIGGKDA